MSGAGFTNTCRLSQHALSPQCEVPACASWSADRLGIPILASIRAILCSKMVTVRSTDSQLAVPATGNIAGASLRLLGSVMIERCGCRRCRGSGSVGGAEDPTAGPPATAPTPPFLNLATAWRGAPTAPACVPAPSPGGCRLRSHGGSQWPDGFSDPSGVSMGCGLLWFSGQLSDECGPGHQIECGIFQYWDVGGRHMAPKHQFGARGQCLGRHGQQLNGVESGRHRKLPQTH